MRDKILVFLGYMDDTLSASTYLKKILRNIPAGNRIIVSVNRFTKGLEDKTGFKINYFEHFLKKEDYEYTEDYAFRISESWHNCFRAEGAAPGFKKIKIAKILQTEMYISLCVVLKNLNIILNVAREEKPSRIVLVGQKKEDWLSGIAAFLNSTLYVKTVYKKIRNKNIATILCGLFRNAKSLFSLVISEILDRAETFYIANAGRYKNTILMDYRFARIITGITDEFSCIDYIVANGLSLRLNFLRRKKPYFSFLKQHRLLNGKRQAGFFREFETYLRQGLCEKKELRYRGYCVYDALKGIFRDYIERNIPFFRDNVCMVYRFFKSVKPKIVILRDSTRMWERSLIEAAKRLDIRTLVVQHGLLSERTVYAKQDAESIALWGEADIEWFKSAGNDLAKSKITGSPTHDDIYLRAPGRTERYENILKSLKADIKKPTVIYLANCTRIYPSNSVYFTPDLSLLSLKATLNAFKEFDDMQIVIKLHPYYTGSEYPKFAREVSVLPNAFIVKDADIPDLFSGSCAVISEAFSSAIMDAIILKKPVIFYNFLKRKEIIPLREKGVGFEVKHPDDIKAAMEYTFSGNRDNFLFSERNVDAFIKDYAYKIDGQSSKRIKDFIKTLVRA